LVVQHVKCTFKQCKNPSLLNSASPLLSAQILNYYMTLAAHRAHSACQANQHCESNGKGVTTTTSQQLGQHAGGQAHLIALWAGLHKYGPRLNSGTITIRAWLRKATDAYVGLSFV
jgi:hypothetical protein